MVSIAAARSAPLPEIDQGIASVVGANGGGLDAEGIEQLEHGLCRNIAQRNHADALAGFGGGGAVDAAGTGFRRRQQPIAPLRSRTSDTPDILQCVFQHVQRVRFRHRANRGQRHGSLHARIDGVADVQYVTQDDLCHRGDRRVFEIEIVAAATAAAIALGQRPRLAGSSRRSGKSPGAMRSAAGGRWLRYPRSGAAADRSTGFVRRRPGRGGLWDCVSID